MVEQKHLLYCYTVTAVKNSCWAGYILQNLQNTLSKTEKKILKSSDLAGKLKNILLDTSN